MSSYQLVLSPTALKHYKRLRAEARSLIKEAMRERLLEEPMREDRNRFRLRRVSPYAEYELRIEQWRVFYRIEDNVVLVELIGEKKNNSLFIEGEEFEL